MRRYHTTTAMSTTSTISTSMARTTHLANPILTHMSTYQCGIRILITRTFTTDMNTDNRSNHEMQHKVGRSESEHLPPTARVNEICHHISPSSLEAIIETYQSGAARFSPCNSL